MSSTSPIRNTNVRSEVPNRKPVEESALLKKVAAVGLALIACAAITAAVLTLTAIVTLPPFAIGVGAGVIGVIALSILLGGIVVHCRKRKQVPVATQSPIPISRAVQKPSTRVATADSSQTAQSGVPTPFVVAQYKQPIHLTNASSDQHGNGEAATDSQQLTAVDMQSSRVLASVIAEFPLLRDRHENDLPKQKPSDQNGTVYPSRVPTPLAVVRHPEPPKQVTNATSNQNGDVGSATSNGRLAIPALKPSGGSSLATGGMKGNVKGLAVLIDQRLQSEEDNEQLDQVIVNSIQRIAVDKLDMQSLRALVAYDARHIDERWKREDEAEEKRRKELMQAKATTE